VKVPGKFLVQWFRELLEGEDFFSRDSWKWRLRESGFVGEDPCEYFFLVVFSKVFGRFFAEDGFLPEA